MKTRGQRALIVPITASGLLGAKPLADGIMRLREFGKMGPKLRDKDWLLGPGDRGRCALSRKRRKRGGCPPERPAKNWSGQGESDCLIKTKHCDVLARC